MNMHKLIPSALTVVLFVSLNLAQSSPDYNAYIPEDKGLDPAWVASLSSRGEQKVYQGQELDLIGMPCGGIGAGQLEISGKGTLGTWWIFNVSPPRNGGLGSANGARYLKPAPIEEIVENDFAIRIQPKNDNPKVLKLDGSDFDDMRFIGEYPIASFDYRRQANDLPVTIRSKVFSPFVPLSVRDSANPVTAFRFTVENTSHDTVNIQLGGWLENACVVRGEDQRLNQVFKGKHLRGVQLGLQSDAQYQTDENPVQKRADLDYDQFEGKAFSSQWTVEGQAFGTGPFNVSLAKFNKPLMNYQGKAVASSFHSERNEQLTGKLISWPFKIERSSIRFKIAGGNHENETCIHLLVDDKVVRAATGDDSNTFRSVTWDVTDLQGQMTRLEIVDQHKGSWGFVKVDDIVFFDKVSPYGDGKPEYGNLAISVMDDQASASAAWTSVVDFINALKENTKVIRNQRLFGAEQIGGGSVISEFTLAPNERKTVTFLISWYFPNLYNELAGGFAGHIYNNWYGNAADAAQWVADNYDRLYEQTELFRRTYHDTTLPYWLANRITMPVSSLACDNIKIHEDGRMYAYEGVSFCYGTCGHVYNFVTAIANLFPELERSVRLMQDFDESFGFDPETGRINFRGHHGPDPLAEHNYATDAQSGYILKAYREHLHTADMTFLSKVWPKVKLAMNYQIFQDGAERGLAPNGVLETKQTFWDPMWYGPNPYNNTLYLAALRAAEEMARLMGEDRLANRYRSAYQSGTKWMQERMWNGEYFVHLYPEGKWSRQIGVITLEEAQKNASDYVHQFSEWDSHYYVSTACDAQQTFGQNWAHQLGLGYILPAEQCFSAAKSIYKYNFTPDISLVYDLYPPRHRTLAAPGEAAMVNAAWPKVCRQSFENTHDKDDIWTGLEYQAACDMINEGLLQEALIMLKAIDGRYDASKRNPWNEIEGAEHYSRAMHAWNVLLTLSGCTYDGPAGKIGFAPKITPHDFKSFFSAADGWGTYQQKRIDKTQIGNLELKYGKLQLKTLSVDVPEGWNLNKVKVAMTGLRKVEASLAQKGSRVHVTLAKPLKVSAGQSLRIEMR